jgi:hypothetical protein
VGLSYKGFEEELLALFTTIEASHSEQALASCSSLGNRELRSLVCSINYDENNGSARCSRVEGKVASVFL